MHAAASGRPGGGMGPGMVLGVGSRFKGCGVWPREGFVCRVAGGMRFGMGWLVGTHRGGSYELRKQGKHEGRCDQQGDSTNPAHKRGTWRT
jgi:hypothetical protein